MIIMYNEKVVLVTGGTRGIGYTTVEEFLKEGARVILFGSREESVTKAINSLKEENNEYKVEGYFTDLANLEEMEKVAKEIATKYGKIDILVNNAGVSSSTPITSYTEEECDKIINLNIKGVFDTSKAVIPYMTGENPSIVNVSSMVSFYGQSSGCLYPTSKFAVNGLTKSLARELGKKKIRVNAVAPGITNTDMVKNLPDEMIKPLIAMIPLGRIGDPKDIASAILFLASDKASYVTGTILQVDGAMMC